MKLLNPRTAHVVRAPSPSAPGPAGLPSQQACSSPAPSPSTRCSPSCAAHPRVIALSHVIDGRAAGDSGRAWSMWCRPGQAVVVELRAFLDHRDVIGWVLLVTMLFFSSLGFKVLENAISVIFLHRVAERRRHFVVSSSCLSATSPSSARLCSRHARARDLVSIVHASRPAGHSWSLGGSRAS